MLIDFSTISGVSYQGYKPTTRGIWSDRAFSWYVCTRDSDGVILSSRIEQESDRLVYPRLRLMEDFFESMEREKNGKCCVFNFTGVR